MALLKSQNGQYAEKFIMYTMTSFQKIYKILVKPPYGQLNIDWLFGSHKSNICTSTDGYNL